MRTGSLFYIGKINRMNIRNVLWIGFFLVLACDTSTMWSQQVEEEEEDEPTLPWSLTAKSKYQTNFVQNGVSMSDDEATVNNSIGLSHTVGLSGSFGTTHGLGTIGGLQSWYLGLEYEYAFSDKFSLGAGLTHTKHMSDSLNAVATLSNTVALSALLDLGVVSVGLSIDRYIGGQGATYASLDVANYTKLGSFSFLSSVDVAYISQNVELSLLRSSKRKKGGSTTTTTANLSGLNGVTLSVSAMYDIAEGFKLSVEPVYVFGMKNEISTQTSQFIMGIGLKYAKDF